MFSKIIQWIQKVWSKMTNKSDVKNAFKIEIATSDLMITQLEIWSNMYINEAGWLVAGRKSMNLPAVVSGEIARATTIEMKVAITGDMEVDEETGVEQAVTQDDTRAAYLQEQMDQVLPKLRQQLEYGCAKGGLVMKPYISGDNIIVDFVQADQFYPVKFDANGRITSCVFSDTQTFGGKWYTRLEYHILDDKGCTIMNQAFVSSTKGSLGVEIDLAQVDSWKDLEPEATIVGCEQPLYGYFKYPQANNIDPTSPLGVSCFSRAIDLIKEADIQWSQLLWEFESGERALYVDELAFQKDADGKPILPIKKLYRALNKSGNIQDEDLFEEWSPDFRETHILNGLDAILRRVEFNCGLAYGTLSNPTTVDKTATEMKISQQRSYATITDCQKSLEYALSDLIYAMDIWSTLSKLAPKGTYEVSYSFDDSVIVDSEAQMLQDRQTVNMGAMPKWKFLQRNYGLSETEARQWVIDNQEEQPEDSFSEYGEF
jgi:A118 family predicted phage portal protein